MVCLRDSKKTSVADRKASGRQAYRRKDRGVRQETLSHFCPYLEVGSYPKYNVKPLMGLKQRRSNLIQ